MADFKLHSQFKPMGDQPEAIRQLSEGVVRGDRDQVLLGITGSGKTFTMANIIEQKVIEAMNKGWGKKNSGIVRKIIADRAGVELDYAPGGFSG